MREHAIRLLVGHSLMKGDVTMVHSCNNRSCTRKAAVQMWDNVYHVYYCLQHAKMKQSSLVGPYLYGKAPVAPYGMRTAAVLLFIN